MFYKADFIRPGNKSGMGSFKYEVTGTEPFFKLINIKPGLFMTVFKQSEHQVKDMAYEISSSPVNFSYILSGSCSHRLHGLKGRKVTQLSLAPLTNNVGHLCDVSGHWDLGRKEPMISVDLKIDRRLLKNYLADRMDRIPRVLHPIIATDSQFYYSVPLERSMMTTAMEVADPPPLSGATLDLFYESRALDLLSKQLEAFTRPGFCYSHEDISPDDLERIHHARTLLVADLENPPTIAVLSRRCGINETKLKKGFKQVFKTTIFSHLQKARMDTAWHLLQQGRHSVTEVGMALGYTNISHFAAAFRRQFAVNPGALKFGSLKKSNIPPLPHP